MVAKTTHFKGIALVLGLGNSGVAAAKALMASGNKVLAWDDSESRKLEAALEGISISKKNHFHWKDIEVLVASPGIPSDHPIISDAQNANVEVMGDFELLWRANPSSKYIGITGTNGKSTTTALIGHIFQKAKCISEVGGNLGIPALKLKTLSAKGTYVLEASSFQLDLTLNMSFTVAILLNISPDHLDRHEHMNKYIKAKKNIFRPGKLKTAIIGIDGKETFNVYQELTKRKDLNVIPVTTTALNSFNHSVTVEDGLLKDKNQIICNLKSAAALPGKHNWQNAAAAYAAARALGINTRTIVDALLSFPGLAHRMELVATIDGVKFINDSKATNIESTAQALACFQSVYWIAGGRSKSDGLEVLEPFYGHILHAFLIGEAKSTFSNKLSGRVKNSQCGTLAKATNEAARLAFANRRNKGATVLLSPACASFDQFLNFEERGNAFKGIVAKLSQQKFVHKESGSL